jgi:hypothetical protein
VNAPNPSADAAPAIVDYARDHVDPLTPFTRENARVLQDLADAWAHQNDRHSTWEYIWLPLFAFSQTVMMTPIRCGIATGIAGLLTWARSYTRGTRVCAYVQIMTWPVFVLVYAVLFFTDPVVGSGLTWMLFVAILLGASFVTVFFWRDYAGLERLKRLETVVVEAKLAERFRHRSDQMRGNRDPGMVFFYHGFFGSTIRIVPVGELLVMTHGAPDRLNFALPDEVRLDSPVQPGPGQMVHLWLTWKGKRQRVRGSQKDFETLRRILANTDYATA